MFKVVGLKWVPTGKVLTNVNSLVDHETPKGLDTNVTNPYICNQVCHVSAGSPYSVAGTSIFHYLRTLKASFSTALGGLQCQGWSMYNDVCSHQFRPRSSTTMTSVHFSSGLALQRQWHLFTSVQASLFNDNDVCSHQFRPRSSNTMTFEYFSSSLGPQCNIMMSADNTSGPVHQGKERCTFQCTLSSKEEKSSWLWPFLTTCFMLSPCSLSHQVDLLAFVSSFTCSIKNGKPRMQFLRGRSVNFLHVVWCCWRMVIRLSSNT